MQILKRNDFLNDFADTPDLLLKAYPMKSGALCEVITKGSMVMFKNGHTTFSNGGLADYCKDYNITGHVLVHHKTQRVGVSKWLTYQHHHGGLAHWGDNIELYVLGDSPKDQGFISVTGIKPIKVSLGNFAQTVDNLSRNEEFDGLLVKGKQGKLYSLKPTRYIVGKVRDIDVEGKEPVITCTVKRDGRTYIIILTKMTRKMQSVISAGGLKNGMQVKIQYTSFIPGDKFANFSAPVALYQME